MFLKLARSFVHTASVHTEYIERPLGKRRFVWKADKRIRVNIAYGSNNTES